MTVREGKIKVCQFPASGGLHMLADDGCKPVVTRVARTSLSPRF
jgi:hypothetical protein